MQVLGLSHREVLLRHTNPEDNGNSGFGDITEYYIPRSHLLGCRGGGCCRTPLLIVAVLIEIVSLY